MRHLPAAVLIVAIIPFITTRPAFGQFEQSRSYVGPHVGLAGVGSGIAVGGAFERAISPTIGVGAFIDYWTFGSGSFDYSYLAVGGAGSYHFSMENDKVDPFVGIALGYYNVGLDDNDICDSAGVDCDSSRIFLGAQGGVRYFIKPATAIVGRLGFGAAYLTVGVEWKL